MLCVTVRSRHATRGGLYQVQSDGASVWVNGPDGSAVGRISKLGGIDVHRPIGEQVERGECLDCRHDVFGLHAWLTFKRSINFHFGVSLAERHRPRWAKTSAPDTRILRSAYWDHGPECKFRRSAECAVAIECPHGHDVCPECDPCTCQTKRPCRIRSSI